MELISLSKLPRKAKNRIGEKYGRLTVIGLGSIDPIAWVCQCECGNEIMCKTTHINSRKSCANCVNLNKKVKLIGKTIGDLTVIEKFSNNNYVIKCKCGRLIKRHKSFLRNSRDCGCNKKTRIRKTENVKRKKYIFPKIKEYWRPKTRGDCKGIQRPCPFVGCKYNLFLEVNLSGNIRYNFPGKDPSEMSDSCVLDVVEKYEDPTLDFIADKIGVSHERVRQIEEKALKKLYKNPKTKEVFIEYLGWLS